MRRLVAALFLAGLMTVPAFAGDGKAGFGGFQGPISGAEAQTVQAALGMPDDARVVLTGNIVSQVAGSKDRYMFKDATGEMVVEIKGKVFAGRSVTPETTVRLAGKIDKDWNEPIELDVKMLEIVK